jgi:hypothetical protein
MSDKIQLAKGITLWRNAHRQTIFRLHYEADPRKGDGKKIFVPEINMFLSPWAHSEYVQSTDKSYYLQEYEIDFGATAGALLFSFSEDATVVDDFPIPHNWTRYMMLDPHPAKPHASLWAAVDPYGEWWIYREYWPSELCFRYLPSGEKAGSSAAVTDREGPIGIKQYVACLKLLESKENPQNGGTKEYIYKRVIDYAARAFGQGDSNQQTDTNFQKEFEKAGEESEFPLDFEDAKKDRDVGVLAVNTALMGRMILDPRAGDEPVRRSKVRILRQACPELIFQLKHNRKRKPTQHEQDNEDPLVKAIRKRNDLTDCLRYFVQSNPEYYDPPDPESENTFIPSSPIGGY